MSKLADMLNRIADHAPGPMGFSPASKKEKQAGTMTVLGLASREKLAKDPELANAGVDAVVLSGAALDADALDAVQTEMGAALWGVQVDAISAEEAESLAARGCDFIVFDPDGTDVGILNQDGLGKVITVSADLSEDVARGIDQLPVDAVFFSPENDVRPLTVGGLIDIQMVLGMVDKPVLMAAPHGLLPGELKSLRDAGLAGLAIGLTPPEEAAKTRKAVENLPPRPDPKLRRNAVIPRMELAPAVVEAPPEEDYDDGDF